MTSWPGIPVELPPVGACLLLPAICATCCNARRTQAGAPKSGDHVLFTGVVWTVTYAALFERLRARGVRFSVLLYDLIPLERPDLVGSAHAQAFAEWLRCVVREAELIFLSTETVREQLYRWCLAEGLAPRNPAQTIPFGPSLLRLAKPAAGPIVTEAFVLSVGTIDPRKNQLFLATAWAKLAAERELPLLVLVGRDDHDLLGSDATVAPLIAAGRIRVLTGVDDAALDALYRAALFTVFPSFIEGHGLPVADSLAYGKLCLSSDLPVIREHAADMPWYFDPHDAGSLIAQLRRALDDGAARAAVEARLATWSPPTWADTARVMGEAVASRLRLPDLDSPGRIPLPGRAGSEYRRHTGADTAVVRHRGSRGLHRRGQLERDGDDPRLHSPHLGEYHGGELRDHRG